jgi:hypothetical protein
MNKWDKINERGEILRKPEKQENNNKINTQNVGINSTDEKWPTRIFFLIIGLLFIIFIIIKVSESSSSVPSNITQSSPENPTSEAIYQTGYAISNATIRTGPTKRYAAIKTITRGTSIYIIERDKATNWYKVQMENSVVGYISGKLISFQQPINPPAIPYNPQVEEEKEINLPNGITYTGFTLNGKPSGKGKELFPDNSYLEGTYINGKRNGIFIYHNTDGTTEEQEFENGIRQK